MYMAENRPYLLLVVVAEAGCTETGMLPVEMLDVARAGDIAMAQVEQDEAGSATLFDRRLVVVKD